ncbi:hypothetical protein [Frigoriglobus tundricola]|uniref:Uncharacterized protein n=1 Tax=Frigoriglobus tundricola TaxID=2774151 RepID=A0A6M5Z483_9BACT|nr:hypothetical protein [Frigoriglobus tundricola]QJX00321.1 hypothetical protein FTUN_7947 [Frigoriglobus tundricola]
MTMRPKNRCQRCNRTWHPRGNNLSLKCPACGSPEVEIAPNPLAALSKLGLMGCIAFGLVSVLCGGVIALVGGGLRPKNPPTQDQSTVAKSDSDASKRTEKRVPDVARSDSVIAKRTEKPAPNAVETVRPSVALAPAPRRVYNSVPAGYSSAWVRLGDTETRVIGAAVRRPVLFGPKGDERTSAELVLLVWVETRRIGPGTVELRRWIGALDADARLAGASGVLTPVRFSGATLGGQLDRGVALVKDGPPVRDLLAFAVPDPNVQTLSLRLAGSHVGEFGFFDHEIPPEAWKGGAAKD